MPCLTCGQHAQRCSGLGVRAGESRRPSNSKQVVGKVRGTDKSGLGCIASPQDACMSRVTGCTANSVAVGMMHADARRRAGCSAR